MSSYENKKKEYIKKINEILDETNDLWILEVIHGFTVNMTKREG